MFLDLIDWLYCQICQNVDKQVIVVCYAFEMIILFDPWLPFNLYTPTPLSLNKWTEDCKNKKDGSWSSSRGRGSSKPVSSVCVCTVMGMGVSSDRQRLTTFLHFGDINNDVDEDDICQNNTVKHLYVYNTHITHTWSSLEKGDCCSTEREKTGGEKLAETQRTSLIKGAIDCKTDFTLS